MIRFGPELRFAVKNELLGSVFYRYVRDRILQLVLLLLIPAVPAVGAYLLLEPPLPVAEGEISIKQIDTLGKEIVWVDARDRDHFEEAHVPRAVLMSSSDMDAGLAGLFNAFSGDKIIVVYCEPDCHASHKVAGHIRDLGLEPVYVLGGGFAAWKQAHP